MVQYRGRLVWSSSEKASLFSATLTPNSVEIVFSNRTLVTHAQYSVLLPYSPV